MSLEGRVSELAVHVQASALFLALFFACIARKSSAARRCAKLGLRDALRKAATGPVPIEACSCSRNGDRETERELAALQPGCIFPPRGMLNKTISHYSNEERLQGSYLTAAAGSSGSLLYTPRHGIIIKPGIWSPAHDPSGTRPHGRCVCPDPRSPARASFLTANKRGNVRLELSSAPPSPHPGTHHEPSNQKCFSTFVRGRLPLQTVHSKNYFFFFFFFSPHKIY